MAQKHILIFSPDPATRELFERSLPDPAAYKFTHTNTLTALEYTLKHQPPDLMVTDERLSTNLEAALDDTFALTSGLIERYPGVPAILLVSTLTIAHLKKAIQIGVADCIEIPLQSGDLFPAVEAAIHRQQHIRDWVRHESRRNTKSLQQRIDDLEALQRISRSLAATLDLDEVLSAVVDAAVELTGAEEGSLLLLDENSGDLYMHAARNFGEDFVRTFRLPVEDSFPGQVLRSGKPIILDEETPQKIKTAYLVHTVMYIPLIVQGRPIGVLGVDNRKSGHMFSKYHLKLVSTLADYAAIAIENANLYTKAANEREKLETLLTRITDGVIVLDKEGCLVLINQSARQAFHVEDEHPVGKPIQHLIDHLELVEILSQANTSPPSRSEIVLEDGRVLYVQTSPIPEIGVVATLQDITRLKELDRIKSEFVNTVSHDLRSPLTAILGYIDLIERVGPVNDTQKEFIHRVGTSVENITTLINDLLDLGRIEAGFDLRRELVPLATLIQYTIESLQEQIAEKNLAVTWDIEADLPQVFGNPSQLRQMLSNLINNAMKYTPAEGSIYIQAVREDGQVILRIEDTGQGIPHADQQHIFDKFFRGSNVSIDVPGTGLGLAIVKSVVENHKGRIWLDSSPERGSKFTVVLPVGKPTAE
ncbi:MAG TPA: ATP-binding protein [Anaerolineales bacterium]|nr:ATP-binding protein [Anaerolineales bacterium]